MLKCSRPVWMELWASWASGRRGGMKELWGPFHPTHYSVVPWEVPVLPLEKVQGENSHWRRKSEPAEISWGFFAQQSSGRTVRNLHCSVNYSRNSFVRETQRKNWVCHFSFGLLCLFLPLFSLLPVNTHPQKKEINWRQHFAWFCKGNLIARCR